MSEANEGQLDVLVRLEGELAKALKSNEHLSSEWRKYRYALNAIAHPVSWSVIPGSEVEIASRALLIGADLDPVPEHAKVKKPNTPITGAAGASNCLEGER